MLAEVPNLLGHPINASERTMSSWRRTSIVTAFIAFLLSPAEAAVRPESKAGALQAGQFVGVAEQCFSGGKSVLTKAARKFAATAERKNPHWYFAAYNDEIKGPPSVYDEAFCNDIAQKDYGPKGAVSKRLGFTIMDVANFVE
ncbi:DUF202 domain-containing protein [Mesorhizobium sp. M0848]|uniref:hypothetical protein n=1 Tax=Mesorhizobium sp. M0848 TaxID=2957012 RepID=UPI00333CA798